ncbi:putative O-glycosylation ligase, exosortase A system-associated [Photobacterium minamisatsumaniensis]|uniref:putative O-glycosylation ligase, exosortase A system-associated n=1 Tax=Photobacterium minamisatsumaniensis TaxID=2910233 RepID=UPI003D0F59D6
MRDGIFMLAFLCLVFIGIQRPFIAVTLWLWSGLIVPKHWVYGFASSFSFNSACAMLTFVSYIVFKVKPRVYFSGLATLSILFFLMTTLTTAMSITIPSLVWAEWEKFFKAFLLCLMIVLIIRKDLHFVMILWGILLSTGLLAGTEALKFLASGGGHNITGPSNHILNDNNHFALVTCMLIPVIIFLFQQEKEKWLRFVLLGAGLVCIIAILGTNSRGGLIGLISISGFFWLKSKRKILMLFVFFILALGAGSILSDSWFNRMNTIQNAEEDSSFMTRVKAWKMYTLMAMERPLLGGGFKALENPVIWGEIASDFDKLDFIETPQPTIGKGWAAHSIYFQVIGDHGFLTFSIFLMVLLKSFLTLNSLIKKVKDNKALLWHSQLAQSLKISLIAFCLSGASLSLPYVEIFWAYISLIIALQFSVIEYERRMNEEESADIASHRAIST